jgi:hypothetical protein
VQFGKNLETPEGNVSPKRRYTSTLLQSITSQKVVKRGYLFNNITKTRNLLKSKCESYDYGIKKAESRGISEGCYATFEGRRLKSSIYIC